MALPAPLIRRASFRYLCRHPWQAGLSVVGISLGVAVAVSVSLANDSARRAFAMSTAAVTGSTTHQVVGGSRGVPQDLYRLLRVELGLRAAAPVIEGYVGAAGHPGRTLRLMGVDPFAEESVRPYFAAGAVGDQQRRLGGVGERVDVAALLTTPNAVAISVETAADLGVDVGAAVDILVGSSTRKVTIIGLLQADSASQRAGMRDVLVADISTAQEMLGMAGRLSRVDLILPAAGVEAEVERLRTRLPEQVQLVDAAARATSTLEMTRAFRLNLTAMSLLAMVCGMFLIYNTMTFSVVQRRPLIASLRALGVTRAEVFVTIVLEAVAIGVVGTVFGLAGGVALGNGLVRLVTRTINDLYFAVTVRELVIAPEILAAGIVLGIGTTLLAALAPAFEATRATPTTALQRSALEARHHHLAPRVAVAGIALASAGGSLIALPTAGLMVTFAGLFALVVGLALLTPVASIALAAALRPSLRTVLGSLGNLAARSVSANLSRTSVAVAALMVAVSVIIGVGVMVSSFRMTLERWLEHTLAADLYVAPVGVGGFGDDLAFDDHLWQRLVALPEVARVQTLRNARLETEEGPLTLQVVGMGVEGNSVYRLESGGPDAWSEFHAGGVLVSEPFAHLHGTRPGAVLRLPTDRGWRPFVVAGVYYSYASDRGAVLIERHTYERFWDDRGTSGLSVYARPNADRRRLEAAVGELFAGRQQVTVIRNRDLRERALRVFDRTFLITGVLRILVMLVAFVGVLSALMAMQLERSRELGILRATGLTPAQLWRLVTVQTGLLGVIAGVLAMPVGIVLAWVMIHVINKRSFGWTLQMQLPPEIFLQAFALAVVAALLAGIYPAARMARTPPAGALRGE